jgi:uncharacterized membrane protein SpoIIM required for sporulation
MRSADFIKTRHATWLALEGAIQALTRFAPKPHSESDLVEFMRAYRRSIADLSLARSLFPNDTLIPELNHLVIRAMACIGGTRPGDGERIKQFFTHRIPQLVIALRRLFYISVTIFGLATLAGFGLTMLNPYAVQAIVGDEYVSMTLENIHNGTPFAVYESSLRYAMSSYIMANNIKVAFMAFALGALYGVGTFAVLMFNGLMLGSIAALFAQNNLLLEFVTTVLIHGTLELFAIMVAGAAGLRFGQSLFRPGQIRRIDALYVFGNEAFRICVAMVPIFIVAGILEGFVTRMHLPIPLRIAIIAASVLLIMLYLVVPALLYNRRRRTQAQIAEPSINLTYS